MAPNTVRSLDLESADWLEIAETPSVATASGLHKGEAAAISLAVALHADLLL